MDRSTLLSGIAGGVANFLLGYLIWGLALMGFMEANAGSATGVAKDPMDYVMLIIGCLIIGIAMAALFSKWSRGAHSPGQGFQFGAWVGVLMGLGMGFVYLGTSNLGTMTSTLVGAVGYIVEYGLTGVVIAMVMKATSKSGD